MHKIWKPNCKNTVISPDINISDIETTRKYRKRAKKEGRNEILG